MSTSGATVGRDASTTAATPASLTGVVAPRLRRFPEIQIHVIAVPPRDFILEN
jgi:hypothetical protein